jgi:hypothetical protein
VPRVVRVLMSRGPSGMRPAAAAVDDHTTGIPASPIAMSTGIISATSNLQLPRAASSGGSRLLLGFQSKNRIAMGWDLAEQCK